MINEKDKIKVKLTSYGSLQALSIPVKLYRDSYNIVGLQCLVPKVVTEGTSIVKVYASSRDVSGTQIWTSATYNLTYDKDVVIDNQTYEQYSAPLPEEFCAETGDVTITFAHVITEQEDEENVAESVLVSGDLNLYISGSGYNHAGVKIPNTDVIAGSVNSLLQSKEIWDKTTQTLVGKKLITEMFQQLVAQGSSLDRGFSISYKSIDSDLDEELGTFTFTIHVTSTPSQNSLDLITSDGVYRALLGKQDTINASNKLNADYINDNASNKKLITAEEKQNIADNTNARHTHDNKALLDTYSQTELNLSDAVSKKHGHANKNVLDSIQGIDETATQGSDNLIKSKAVYEALQNINVNADITVDDELSTISENPVQNKVIAQVLNAIIENVEGRTKSYVVYTPWDDTAPGWSSTYSYISFGGNLDEMGIYTYPDRQYVRMSDLKVGDVVYVIDSNDTYNHNGFQEANTPPDRWVGNITGSGDNKTIYFYAMESKTNLTGYVKTARTIAGLALTSDITAAQLRTALEDAQHRFVTDAQKNAWDAITSVVIDATSGSESIGDGTDTIDVVTRDTSQTITAPKTIDIGGENITTHVSASASSISAYHNKYDENDVIVSQGNFSIDDDSIESNFLGYDENDNVGVVRVKEDADGFKATYRNIDDVTNPTSTKEVSVSADANSVELKFVNTTNGTTTTHSFKVDANGIKSDGVIVQKETDNRLNTESKSIYGAINEINSKIVDANAQLEEILGV